ncbi:glycerate kinase [Thermoclostridium stercorarium subsp. thermolacticum DSM 2910]|jgi:glycerate kinase|uniref:Glycerate kinase n=1 Tax=Thermoclostridium stercorarium subsp. thermolacticum DSM 2910 TaxID=1121336 RepID=A0A1B1YAN6_THEST|nr:glycerate kinase [Thermoclostridium stercorarium]ANW97808.1 glycerate kinase [Thermoclostridium stercorarium subsp. thermolacticum DSM 2910]UZQ85882.1 glycerate kinase [Thermoclostridium stercorarium]
MKKVILAPDSFKGTMSSIKVCDIMEEKIKKFFPLAEVIKIPVADGGEGTVDSFLKAVGGTKVRVKVSGPYFETIDSFYGILPDGKTAVIEMAAAAGLPLVENRKNPLSTTTYGVGELIRHAVLNGCRNIIIGLGGSCTNDGGAGLAAALGVKFYDDVGKEFVPVGGTLSRIERIDISEMQNLSGLTVTAMCDVNNPLCGENGAAKVFGPQKGADEETAELLDRNLRHFADVIRSQFGKDIADIPGAGAAGGMGAGVAVFLNAGLKQGIDVVLDTVEFDRLLDRADLVFTGEGKIDGQSLRGKVVYGVAARAKKHGVPVVAVAGDIGDDIEEIYKLGVSAIVSINRMAIPFEMARHRSEKDLALTMETIMRLISLNAAT